MVRARTADSRGTHPRPPGATTAPPSRVAAAARRPERCGTPRDESGCIPSPSGQRCGCPAPRGARLLLRQTTRSEEHTSELQSLAYLVCRLLLEKKKNIKS